MYYISDLLIPLLIFIILISIYFFKKKKGKNDNIIYYLTFIFYAFFWNMPAILQIILSPVFALIIVYFIRFKISTIQKNYLSYALLAHVVFFAFLMFTSINDEIRFDDVKNIRYQQVILKLKDIRDSRGIISSPIPSSWDYCEKGISHFNSRNNARRSNANFNFKLLCFWGW